MNGYLAITQAALCAALSDDLEDHRILVDEICKKQQQQGAAPIEDSALLGAAAALESAIFSKDTNEARNIAALVCRAFR